MLCGIFSIILLSRYQVSVTIICLQTLSNFPMQGWGWFRITQLITIALDDKNNRVEIQHEFQFLSKK